MSFQAYLDTIEDRTGLTPRELLALAHDRGLDQQPIKAGAIIDWLKKNTDSDGPHRDESSELWLDGKNNRPA
jgi:hypothetical protein